MNITKLLTSYNKTTKSSRNIKYIVIHYVGATGGAKANCEYYASRYVGSSAHYFVGHKGEVYQSVEDKDVAWHCGASSYKHADCRNANAIGIELCCRNNGSWYFEQATVDAGVELTKELMKKHNIPADRVIRHYEVTGKCCPAPMVNNPKMWEDFKKALVGDVKVEAKPAVEEVKATTTKKTVVVLKQGGKGAAVKKLQENLKALGYDCGNIDGQFGEKTKTAVCKFQRANGLAVDGLVGEKTQAKIEACLKAKADAEKAAAKAVANVVSRLQTELNASYKAGLKVDGIFGAKTLAACPTIKKGAKGNLVKILQELLHKHAGFTGAIDGIFGTATVNGVKKLQKTNKLYADGIVGKNTWKALLTK